MWSCAHGNLGFTQLSHCFLGDSSQFHSSHMRCSCTRAPALRLCYTRRFLWETTRQATCTSDTYIQGGFLYMRFFSHALGKGFFHMRRARVFCLKTVFFEPLHTKPCRTIMKSPQKTSFVAETLNISNFGPKIGNRTCRGGRRRSAGRSQAVGAGRRRSAPVARGRRRSAGGRVGGPGVA